jgi:hypothetical protein
MRRRSMLRDIVPLVGVAIGALSAGPATASDYWRCVDGQWTAVGRPTHPMPLRACGPRPALPRDQADCTAAGGHWGRAGISPVPSCRMPTRDAGRVCADDGECEGACLRTLTPAERDRLRARDTVPGTGTCTTVVQPLGCQARVEQGVVRRILCLD